MGPKRESKQQTIASSKQNDSISSPSKGQTFLLSPPSKKTAGKLKPVKKSQASAGLTRKPAGSPSSNKSADVGVKQDDQNIRPKGSIQSFFNNATQRLQSQPQSPRRNSRASTPLDLTETIESDDDSSSIVSFSKGSSTALALRKRKSYHSSSTLAHAEDALPASQKFRRTGENARTPSMSLNNEDKRPWTVQFAPTSLAELAVHKRKVADVRGWLESAFASRRNKALIIKGPAGSGKTTALRLLAEDLGIGVLEWSSPAGKDYVDTSQTSSAQFEEWIARAGKSNGLTLVQDDSDQHLLKNSINNTVSAEPTGNQLLLVEEFPNTFSKTSPALQSFRSAIAQHLVSRSLGSSSPVPLVMVISETLLSTNTAAADSFTCHRLLGPELSVHPFIDTIEFNPIAPTILAKALETVVVKEARKSGRRTTPGSAVLDCMTESGDIRSAVSTLEFLCLRGDEDGNWSARIAFGKTKKRPANTPLTKVEKEILDWMTSRQNNIGIFHAVGRVLYNKRIEPAVPVIAPPSWLSHFHRSKVPEHDVNTLVDDVGTDTSTFIAALHENYPLSCTSSGTEESLELALGCIESLSDSDLLFFDRFSYGNRAFTGSATDSLRQDEMSFQLALRGLLLNIPANVKRVAPTGGPRSDAHRMYYPNSLKLWKRQEEVDAAIESLKLQLRSVLSTSKRQPDTAYSLANTNVTSWAPVREADEHEDSEPSTTLPFLAMASKELMLDSLPYLSSILQPSASRTILGLLKTVTRITGSSPDDTSNEDDFNATADDEVGAHVDQWATDRSDDTTLRSQKPRPVKQLGETAFSSTSLPIERHVDNLVLADDDIVDD